MEISPRLFQWLIAVRWLVFVAVVITHQATQHLLPPDLAQSLHAYRLDAHTARTPAWLIVDGTVVVLFIAAYCGLLFFQRWARMLLVAIAFLYPLAVRPEQIVVNFGPVSALSHLPSLLDGLVLAAAFSSPVKERFATRSENR